MSNSKSWVEIASLPLTNGKSVVISRGVDNDVKLSNTKAASVFTLSLTQDHNSGYRTKIPMVAEVVAAMKAHCEGTMAIPKSGFFVESDSRNYLLLENRNKEITLSFEKNFYRNNVRLSVEEMNAIVRFNRTKQFLYEKTRPKSGGKQADGQELGLFIQLWTALYMKTPHEVGTCSCADVAEGWPCALSANRSVTDRVKEVMSTSEYFAETLKNINLFREMLGISINYDGASERVVPLAAAPPEDNDWSLLVRSVLKKE